MSGLEVAVWDEDEDSGMDTGQTDTGLLGDAAHVETEEAICARLVPALCGRGDVTALHQLAAQLTEIPEPYLADIIFTTLTAGGDDADTALDKLLLLPYTPAAMTAALRRRHLSDVVRLAEHVTRRLPAAEADLTEALVDWLTVLLDAQYASLVLSDRPEVLQLIERVAEWRDGQERAAQEATLLLRTLDQLQALSHDPPSPPAANYCVEILHL